MRLRDEFDVRFMVDLIARSKARPDENCLVESEFVKTHEFSEHVLESAKPVVLSKFRTTDELMRERQPVGEGKRPRSPGGATQVIVENFKPETRRTKPEM
jgi:hypothetical protein